MEQLISTATKRNWNKLNTLNIEDKLTSRANKKRSRKRLLPLEYFTNTENVEKVKRFVDEILEQAFKVEDVLYSLALNLLEKRGLTVNGVSRKKNIEALINEYKHYQKIDCVYKYPIPLDEVDLLGLIYQSLQIEGDKNQSGMYYTPRHIVREMLSNLQFSGNEAVLDPCCGSSMFLLCIDNIEPEQLYGLDCDPLAVMISKCNLVMKYPTHEFTPQIDLQDYFALDSQRNRTEHSIHGIAFDYIVTNPPWGAVSEKLVKIQERITSGESFSLFLLHSLARLKPNGQVAFLLPESFFNVKTHKDIRELVLREYCLEKVSVYARLFSGVTTKFASIVIGNKPQKETVSIDYLGRTSNVSIAMYQASQNRVFSLIDNRDCRIIEQIYSQKAYDLSDSIWAIGIVTGDNRNKLSDKPLIGWEPIYTGKEVKSYTLLPYRKYILYDRTRLQQVARDDIYRATEKLVYKFISNRLTFAYDDSRSLFLNSANILIPNIVGYSIKSALAFLNSELFRYIYAKKFGEIKILKGNLNELPFPRITQEIDRRLSSLVDRILEGDRDREIEINEAIYDIFGVNQAERNYIRGEWE